MKTPPPAFSPPPGRGFAGKLLAWFATAMRPLPWRNGYDPYCVWISEIMLQQTQAARGVRHYREWMRRFPDIRSVAEADEEAVLAAWEGLGYYSRARNLHAAAKRIMREHGGEFPRTLADIRALPGVGAYTAAAIAAIAFNLPEPAVDANVIRIFARLCDIDAPASDKTVRAFVERTARALIPADSPRMFCQALMELGALVCGKNPKCGDCPLAGHCAARRRGTTAERPQKKAGTGYRRLDMGAAVVLRRGRAFIRKRPASGLWAGLWEFPGDFLAPGEAPEEAVLRHAREATGLPVALRRPIAVVRHGYLDRRVTLYGYLCEAKSGGKDERLSAAGVWVRPGDLSGYAFSAGHRKLLERLGWKAGTG